MLPAEEGSRFGRDVHGAVIAGVRYSWRSAEGHRTLVFVDRVKRCGFHSR